LRISENLRTSGATEKTSTIKNYRSWRTCTGHHSHCSTASSDTFKGKSKVVATHVMQTHGGVELQLHSFLIVLFFFNCVFNILFVSIVLFYVLFMCKCVLYYCHRVSTQLQLKIYHIIPYATCHMSHIMSYHTISYHISYHIYHIISHHIVSYRIISYRIASHRIVSYHISHHITSHHITSHHITSHHIIYHIIYHSLGARQN